MPPFMPERSVGGPSRDPPQPVLMLLPKDSAQNRFARFGQENCMRRSRGIAIAIGIAVGVIATAFFATAAAA
jgi:hypothetical protein